MAKYTLDQVKIWLQNNPVLTYQQAQQFREVLHSKALTGARLTSIIEVVELLDFDNNHIEIYKTVTDIILNFLLNDDDASEQAGELDWISETLGDSVVTKLQASTLPNKVKKHIFLEIEKYANNILSQNLLDAIAIAKQ